jgi:hypothetical protein
MFIATKRQLIFYWDYSHTAFISDGRFGYIPPEQLARVDTPCFKVYPSSDLGVSIRPTPSCLRQTEKQKKSKYCKPNGL